MDTTLRRDDGLEVRAGSVLTVPSAFAGGPSHVVALVSSPAGVEVVVAGGREARVAGVAADHHLVAVGQVVEIGGQRFTVVREGPCSALLEVELHGVRVAVGAPGWSVGGSDADALRHPALPPRALQFGPGDEVSVGADAVGDGGFVAAGRLVRVRDSLTLWFGPVSVRVVRREANRVAPHRVELALRASGGRLSVCLPHRDPVGVALTPLRARLLAELLRAWPGAVSDASLIGALWPNAGSRGRADVEQVVLRLRRDLHRAGLPSDWVTRIASEATTGVALAGGATVRVEPGVLPRM